MILLEENNTENIEENIKVIIVGWNMRVRKIYR